MNQESKRVLGSMKNKVVAPELLEERANCNFDQAEMKQVMSPIMNEVIEQCAKDIKEDPWLAQTVSHKYYEMTREELHLMWMKKMHYLWNKNRQFYFKYGKGKGMQ